VRGRLAEEDLTERDNKYQVVQQEVPNRRRQEPDIILELACLLLAFVIRSIQYNQLVLEVDVPPPLGIMLGNREQLALAQRLARTYMDQDQELFQELVSHSLISFNRFLLPGLGAIRGSIQEQVLQ
jgi:hypothetical protein